MRNKLLSFLIINNKLQFFRRLVITPGSFVKRTTVPINVVTIDVFETFTE